MPYHDKSFCPGEENWDCTLAPRNGCETCLGTCLGNIQVDNTCTRMYTLLGTNISPEKSILKMIFLFPRWDMLISWRVLMLIHKLSCIVS